MLDQIKKAFKKKEKKKEGPTPEKIEKVRQNIWREMEKRLRKPKRKSKTGITFGALEKIEKVRQNIWREMEKRLRKPKRKSKTGITFGAFGNCKSIPAGYDFTFPKVSEVRRQKREQKEKELAANVSV